VAAAVVVLALVVAATMLRPESTTASPDVAAAKMATPQPPRSNWAVLGESRRAYEPELAGVGRAGANAEGELEEGDAA
jgi:hypothetical protein